MSGDTIRIQITGLEVAPASVILDRLGQLLQRLWTTGSLHALLELPEGRDAAALWEQVSTLVGEKLEQAKRDGQTSIDYWLEVPAHSARPTVMFVQGLLQRGFRADLLTDEDMAFAQRYMDQALQAVVAAGL